MMQWISRTLRADQPPPRIFELTYYTWNSICTVEFAPQHPHTVMLITRIVIFIEIFFVQFYTIIHDDHITQN